MGEWKEYKLGDICERLSSGKGISMKDTAKIGDYPIYGGNGIRGYSHKSNFSGDCAIIGRQGAYCGNVRYFYGTAYMTEHAVVLVANKEHNTRFLSYFLSLQNIGGLSAQSAQPGISVRTLAEQKYLLPPLEEQERIAGVLSSLDDKIELLNNQNKTLEAMAETLFRHHFIEKDNDGTIEQLIRIQNGYAFKSSDFQEDGENNVIKIKNISGGVVDINNADRIDSEIAKKVSGRFKISTGDILIAMTGAEVGKLGIIPASDKKLWLNQRVGLLIEKYKGAKYLAYLQLKSDFGQDYIENTATGSAQPNISGTGIEQCGFPKLDSADTITYSKQIGELYGKVIFNLGQIQTLAKLRDTLLPQLMNKEIQVNG